jgi:ketosteroid isomerase-like protein
MMRKSETCKIAAVFLMLAGLSGVAADDTDVLTQHVFDTEAAFAQTMADRDFNAFNGFLSEEAIFFAGPSPLRGKQAVSDAWAPYFQDPDPPFSWAPETVVVLDSGTLALSSGPVLNAAGNRVATFNSVWRLDPDGSWRIIFDKGSRYCEPPPPVESN